MATQEFEDALDRILAEIELDSVPAEFIQGACITSDDDETYIVSKEEFEDIMLDDATLEEQGISEIGLILDLKEVREMINFYSEMILKAVPL